MSERRTLWFGKENDMNKTIKKIVSFLCLTTLLLSAVVMTAAAEPEFEVAVNLITYQDASQDKLDITVVPEGNDMWVTVAVTKENGRPLGIIQQKVNETNNITFPMTNISGGEEVTVKVSVSPSDNYKTFKKIYYTFAQQQQAIDDIMNPDISITQEIADIISLELEGDFGLISPVDGIQFMKAQLAKEFEGQEIIDVQTFIDKLNEKISISILSGKDADIIKPYMENRKNTIGIGSLIEYGWYEELDDETEKMTQIVSRLATKTYTSHEAFVEAFKAENFLNKLSTKHASDVVNFIYENDDRMTVDGEALALNWEAYEKLQPGQKEYLPTLMAGVRYDSLKTFSSAFTSAISKASLYVEKQEETPSNPGVQKPGASLGVIGGGGSFGGGTIIPSAPATPAVPEPAKGFKDISSVPWAQEAIEALAKEGVINGIDGENFAPEALITREQYVKIIVGAFGLTGDEASAEFADVENGQWYSEFIKIAVSNGIINGVSDSNFGIGANINRQDMAVIIYRTAQKLGIELAKVTQDVPADIEETADYAKDAVIALYQAGIINGVGDGRFAPADTATRAQAAKIIYGLREVR